MPSSYRHLTHEESCEVYARKKSERSVAFIAQQLVRARTTI